MCVLHAPSIAQALAAEVGRVLAQYLDPMIAELKAASVAADDDGEVLISLVEGMLGNAEVAGTRHAVRAGKLVGFAQLRSARPSHSILGMSPADAPAPEPSTVGFAVKAVLPLEVLLRLRPAAPKRGREEGVVSAGSHGDGGGKMARTDPG